VCETCLSKDGLAQSQGPWLVALGVPSTRASKLPAAMPNMSSDGRPRCPPKTAFESDYDLKEEVLGTGMSGPVRSAQARDTGRIVAVKTFEVDGFSARQCSDLKNEIDNQSLVDHPNVARLHDWYESPDRVHLVVEKLHGGIIFEQGVDCALCEERAATVLAQILRAVEHLHGQGVVHRDIKLENLMYARADEDHVKLIDFGLSCRWKEAERPLHRTCGTPVYIAPEVLLGAYTNKADLWSVGVVAHELLTGESPGLDFWTRTPIFSQRLKGCSPEASDFVKRLLTEDTSRLSASDALRRTWIRKKARSIDFSASKDCLSTCASQSISSPSPPSSRKAATRDSQQPHMHMHTTDADDAAGDAAGDAAARKSRWPKIFTASTIMSVLHRARRKDRAATLSQVVPDHTAS